MTTTPCRTAFRVLASSLVAVVVIAPAWAQPFRPKTEVDNIRTKRQILLPDGEPAAGAKVLIRTFTGRNERDLKLQSETALIADDQGIFSAQTELANVWHTTVLVDVPGCALMIAPLRTLRRNHRLINEPIDPVHLTPDYKFTGRVVDEAEVAVAGAQVLYADRRVNSLTVGVSTPQLITRSAADGTFSLRGIALGQPVFSGQPLKFYALVKNDEDLKAVGGQWIWIKPAERATAAQTLQASAIEPLYIVLRPTITVRGQVVNDIINQPVLDAIVELESDPLSYTPLPPPKTLEDGRFEYTFVPVLPNFDFSFSRVYPLRIKASHETLAMVQASFYESIPPEKVKSLYEVTLRMRPVVEVSGRVIDIETGRAPLWPPSLHAHRYETDEAGYRQSGFSSETKVAPDGRFLIQVAAGPNRLQFQGPGFYNWEGVVVEAPGQPAIDAPQAEILEVQWDNPNAAVLQVGAQGHRDLLIHVRKRPGIWLHLDTDEPTVKAGSIPFELQTRAVGETEPSRRWTWSLRREGTFVPTTQWGNAVEARVMNYYKEILPWTTISADPEQRPYIVSIRTQPPASAAIGANLPLLFTTMGEWWKTQLRD